MQDTTTGGYHDGSYPGYADNSAYPPMAGYDQYGQAAQPYGQQAYVDPNIAGAAGMGARDTPVKSRRGQVSYISLKQTTARERAVSNRWGIELRNDEGYSSLGWGGA